MHRALYRNLLRLAHAYDRAPALKAFLQASPQFFYNPSEHEVQEVSTLPPEYLRRLRKNSHALADSDVDPLVDHYLRRLTRGPQHYTPSASLVAVLREGFLSAARGLGEGRGGEKGRFRVGPDHLKKKIRK
eukprot:RCo048060